MTPKEFSVLLKGIQAMYPRDNICPDDASKTVWYRVLGDLDYAHATAAVQRHACTSRFAPSIAEIREQAVRVSTPEQRDWLEGWNDVQQAIHRWGMHRPQEALEALKKKDPATAKIAEMLGWQNLCMSENPTADRANFRQCYETMTARWKETAKLPPAINTMVTGIADRYKIGGVE